MQNLLLGQTGVLQLVADFNYDCSAAFATIEVFPMHPDANWCVRFGAAGHDIEGAGEAAGSDIE